MASGRSNFGVLLVLVSLGCQVNCLDENVVVVSNGEAISELADTVNVSLCQLQGSDNKTVNYERAGECINEAVLRGAQLVVLPECWNSPYDTKLFRQYAEEIPSGPSTKFLVDTAVALNVWIIGGTIPELDAISDKIYNTGLVISPTGEVVTIHRKMHLFDIDIPGKVTFRESDTLSAGNQISTFSTPFGVIGVAICYDLRFPELSLLMREQGARVMVFPSAFAVTTGKAHWEVLARARAIDTQSFVLMASPARSQDGGYQAWGHSMVVDPWGDVLVEAEDTPTSIHAKLDFSRLSEVRRNVPISIQRRPDVYKLQRAAPV